jgi:hypothetical protein
MRAREAGEFGSDIDAVLVEPLLDRAVGLRTFLTADDRVEKVAAFVAEHFKEAVLPLGYKAFLVGVNREACAKYKRALDNLLPPEWSEAVYTENRVPSGPDAGPGAGGFPPPGGSMGPITAGGSRQTFNRRMYM